MDLLCQLAANSIYFKYRVHNERTDVEQVENIMPLARGGWVALWHCARGPAPVRGPALRQLIVAKDGIMHGIVFDSPSV